MGKAALKMSPKVSIGKRLVTTAILGLALSSATAFASSDCNQSAIQANTNAILQSANDNLSSWVAQPANVTGCLSGLQALNISVGTFDMSSIFNQLMNQVCQMAVGQINNITNGAVSQVNGAISSTAPGAGSVVSVGTGSTGVTVNNGGANSALMPTVNSGVSSLNSATNVLGN